ncbi:MAG: hypothetical protein JNN11_02675 [Candidatus Doudnabacteria bacterium]|nr:hypothetical protein [Candidatus Doudnabacteria bacterium]
MIYIFQISNSRIALVVDHNWEDAQDELARQVPNQELHRLGCYENGGTSIYDLKA